MTMTRSMNAHQYAPASYDPTSTPGFITVTNVNNIPNTWAIARPVSAPSPKYSPPAQIARPAQEFAFSPLRPRVEMDPSDSATWQREYRFT